MVDEIRILEIIATSGAAERTFGRFPHVGQLTGDHGRSWDNHTINKVKSECVERYGIVQLLNSHLRRKIRSIHGVLNPVRRELCGKREESTSHN
eukprot:scaffold5547_cov163-Amphora_coffeaeformis.AAC.1